MSIKQRLDSISKYALAAVLACAAVVPVGAAGYFYKANEDASLRLANTALQQQAALLQPQATAQDVTTISDQEQKDGKTVKVDGSKVAGAHLVPYAATKDGQAEQKVAVFAGNDQYVTTLTLQAPQG